MKDALGNSIIVGNMYALYTSSSRNDRVFIGKAAKILPNGRVHLEIIRQRISDYLYEKKNGKIISDSYDMRETKVNDRFKMAKPWKLIPIKEE